MARERGDLLMRRETQSEAETKTLQSLVAREEAAATAAARLDEDTRRLHDKLREIDMVRERVVEERGAATRDREGISAEKQRLESLAARVLEDSEEARRMHAQALADKEWTTSTKARFEAMQREIDDGKDDLERRGRSLRSLQTVVDTERREVTKVTSAKAIDAFARRDPRSAASAYPPRRHADPTAADAAPPPRPVTASGHCGMVPPTRTAAERIAQEQRMFLDALQAGVDVSDYPATGGPPQRQRQGAAPISAAAARHEAAGGSRDGTSSPPRPGTAPV